MLFPTARYFLFCLILLFSAMPSQGGMTSYTDRGKTDFDTALQILNPYGTWSKINELWAYTPLDRQAPYTHGQWIYTEYGWYWKGALPHSWLTEHYGYWRRGADRVWSWYPGNFWVPAIVELRATSTHIGWRSGAVDSNGNYLEEPADRYAKADEWTFVTLAQFAGPITPDIIAKPDAAKELLEDSTESNHTYLTYRVIDRPGPHPADFLAFAKDGGMFPPRTAEDEAPAPAAPNPATKGTGAPSPAATMTGTNAPTLIGADPDQQVDPRKVKYWITMSLPTYWTPPPPDAKSNEIYLYHPDFYQDTDGIARRITLWFNPRIRVSLQEALASSTGTPNTRPQQQTNSAPAAPAVPAVPAESAESENAFRSPFEDGFRPTPSASSKKETTSPPPAPASEATNAPVPLPLTNAPPAHSP